MRADPVGAELLWLETLQQVTARAAHELKGALNGVSVNLEVVRGRALQPEQPASAVARFAGSAAVQLDVVIEMNEALLALGRRPRDPVDVAAVLRHLAALLVPAARAAGVPLDVAASPDAMPAATLAPAIAVRTVLARVLLAAIERGTGGRLVPRVQDASICIDLAAASGSLELDPATMACAEANRIRLENHGSVLTMTFPAAASLAAPLGAVTHGIV